MQSDAKEIYIPSADRVHRLHVAVWEPEKEVRAVVQISHGMVEHVLRYQEFARYLNSQGILVIGNDHLGHGLSVQSEKDFGYFGYGSESSKIVVADLHRVTRYAKKKYGGVPYFLLGHSMGSFMARRYLMTYGRELDGAIIMGTGYQPFLRLCTARAMAAVIRMVKGPGYRSGLLKKAAFGRYNARIDNPRTSNDWLTKETSAVDAYNRDKLCNFSFTADGYQTLFGVIACIQRKKNYNRIPKDLPVFMVAGMDDPVGDYGRGVKKVFASYRAVGLRDLELKLYRTDRHELLNETDRDVVFADIRDWILMRV